MLRGGILCDVIDKRREDFLLFVRKLHHTINKLEKFSVTSNEVTGTASGLKLLTQPFKLKLSKSPEEIDPSVSFPRIFTEFSSKIIRASVYVTLLKLQKTD